MHPPTPFACAVHDTYVHIRLKFLNPFLAMWCVLQEWNVQQLCYEVDVEPYARTRDATINQLAAAAGVQVSAHVSHTLYVSFLTCQPVCRFCHQPFLATLSKEACTCNLQQPSLIHPPTRPSTYSPTHHPPKVFLPLALWHFQVQDTDMMVKRSGGKPPLTMQSFTKLVDKVGDPPAPLPAPAAIPPPGDLVATWGSPLEVPTLQEVGFTGTPTTIFKVCKACYACKVRASWLPDDSDVLDKVLACPGLLCSVVGVAKAPDPVAGSSESSISPRLHQHNQPHGGTVATCNHAKGAMCAVFVPWRRVARAKRCPAWKIT